MLEDVVKENVVQIVTDNGSAFVKAGKMMIVRYNIYWTQCVGHYTDLMFEDIGRKETVPQS